MIFDIFVLYYIFYGGYISQNSTNYYFFSEIQPFALLEF